MLKEYLQKNNISVYKLSKKSDVPYSTLNDLVNLKLPVENIRAGQLKSIADALDVEMDELYNLCIYRKKVFSERYNVYGDVLIRQKSFYIVFCQSGKKYTREVMPVKHESILYIDILAQWKLDEELSKLELEAAYESLHF